MAVKINLLPHREAKRKARNSHFNMLLGLSALVGLAILGSCYFYNQNRIEIQDGRNEFMTGENKKLDAQIAEIETLKKEKDQLLARKVVVEKLQANRGESVRVWDQLERQMPEGVYLKEVKQEDKKITLIGYTQSNARVSTLMNNLDASPVFEKPLLIEIKAAQVNNQRLGEFTLEIMITRQEATDDIKKPKDVNASKQP